MYVCLALNYDGVEVYLSTQISFGSHFWPVMTPEKLWAFLDVVMELNIPFVRGAHSPFSETANSCERYRS